MIPRTKVVFYGSEISETGNTELQSYCNSRGEIYIAIKDPDNDLNNAFICLDKPTAIRFSRVLRSEIAKMTEGGE